VDIEAGEIINPTEIGAPFKGRGEEVGGREFREP